MCGEAHGACTPETVEAKKNVTTVLVGDMRRDTDRTIGDPRLEPTGYVSAEDVLEPMPGREGAFTTKYKRGWPVPLIEAVRQGTVEVEQLTKEQRVGLMQQAVADPAAKVVLLEALREKAKRVRDKMIATGEVANKAEVEP